MSFFASAGERALSSETDEQRQRRQGRKFGHLATVMYEELARA